MSDYSHAETLSTLETTTTGHAPGPTQQFRAITLDTEGTLTEVQWDTRKGTLPHLQAAVDGYVEVVQLSESIDMWVNEEGIIKGLPVNWLATTIASAHGFHHQAYHGDVVFTGGADDEGDTIELSESDAAIIRRIVTTERLG